MTYPNIDPLDWNTVQPEVDRLLGAEVKPAQVEGWLREWSDLEAVLDEAGSAIHRAVTENTADEEAEKRFLHLVEEILPKARVAEQALRDKLLSTPGYQPAGDTALLWRRFQAEAELFRPENVPLMTELAKLGNEYDKIVGSMTVDWDGTQETLPQAQVHLHDADGAVRERAWRGIMACWADQREALDNLYLKMLALRRQIARQAGKPDFRAYAWQDRQRFDYTPEDTLAFHDAIEHEVVPVARRLYEEQAQGLGVPTLRPWDTQADPTGRPLRPFRDVAELEEGAQHIFDRVDPAFGGYYRQMRDGWLDLGTRPHKAPGGYCSDFPISRKPYIFMSAAGTPDDVRTLLHEGGHSFHFMESISQPLLWNVSAGPEFSEVASMSMEMLGMPYLARDEGGFYSQDDARRAYVEQLERVVQFLPYMAFVDAFQHWVYTEAPEEVTAADLDAQCRALWDRFMQGVDCSGLEAERDTEWHRKLHIFQIPFYYVEYGLAQLGALQVWRNALRDQAEAVAAYRGALALGHTRSLPELYAAAGAKFAWDRETVGGLMRLIEAKREELRDAKW